MIKIINISSTLRATTALKNRKIFNFFFSKERTACISSVMKRPLLFAFFLISFYVTKAQSFGFSISNEKDVVEIPFEIHNNFMVVEVTLNKRLPLKFIFDTGAEHTILSKNILVNPLGLSYDRTIPILGADMNRALTAYVSTNVHIQVGDAIAPQQDILILAEDYFQIDEYVGLAIHGIIGADLFRNLVLKIDNRKNLITLRRTSSFKKPRGKWKEVPATIEKNKPYLSTTGTYNNRKVNLKLLLDTGASLSLLLHTNTSMDLDLPESFIKGSVGKGLGGVLEGYLGRIKRLEFGDFFFNNIITNFQDISETINLESVSQRNGILGNALMRRFNIIIDYPKSKVYFYPHRKYNKGFKYDKSGLEVITSGEKLKKITVYNILENSPGYEAGFQKGDQILSVNYIPIGLLQLRGVSRKLTKKAGKKIRMKVRRNGKIIYLKFKLRDLI